MRDTYVALDRCAYCGRPGTVTWDADLVTCRHETCEALAYAELRRRANRGKGGACPSSGRPGRPMSLRARTRRAR